MNYKLAAPKLLCMQLNRAIENPNSDPPSFTLKSLLFQRVWLQGILVPSVGGGFLLDDGTGVVELQISGEFKNFELETGMYVMVVGGYITLPNQIPQLRVHKIVDLSPFPDREAMWYLEVIEAYNLFYRY